RRQLGVIGDEIVAALVHRHDMPGRQPMAERVPTRIFLAFQSLRPGAPHRIRPVRHDLCVCRHRILLPTADITRLALKTRGSYLLPARSTMDGMYLSKKNRIA